VVGQSKEDISDYRGLRDVAMATNFLAKMGKNVTKMATTSVVCVTEFGFEIGFVLSWNSSVTLWYTRDKSALPWQPILGLKLV